MKNSLKKLGDTLDYYNDSMPRKAVESIFDKKDNNEEDIITGYKEEADEEKPDYEAPPQKPVSEPRAKSKIVEEETEIPPREIPAVKIERESKASKLRMPPLEDEGSLEDILAIYSSERRATRTEKVIHEYNEEREFSKPHSTDVYEDYDTETKPRTSYKKTKSAYEDYDEIDDTAEPEVARDRPRASERIDPATRPPQRTRTIPTKPDRPRPMPVDDYDDDQPIPVAKIAFGVATVAVLLVFTLLIFRINSINAENQGLEAAIETYKKDQNQLTMDNEVLSAKIASLEIDLANAASTIEGMNQSESELPDAQNNEDNPSQTGSNDTPGTYIVVAGDNLSKISRKFYGTPNDYQKIIDANGLTTEDVYIGQELIIP